MPTSNLRKTPSPALVDLAADNADPNRLSLCVVGAMIDGKNVIFDNHTTMVSTVKVGILDALCTKERKYHRKAIRVIPNHSGSRILLAW
jgi:hypothetical protein